MTKELPKKTPWRCTRCCLGTGAYPVEPQSPDDECDNCGDPVPMGVQDHLRLKRQDGLFTQLRSEVKVPTTRLYSYTVAAKMLGISRNEALHDLIKDGVIKTVMKRGRPCIPASEIERLIRDGIPQAGRQRQR